MNAITREAILHIPKSNYSYGYDKDTLHIRIRTKKGEVNKVTLRIGDPYDWQDGGAGGGNLNASGSNWVGAKNLQMKKEVESKYFDYWFTSYKPEFKRSRYAFILENEKESILYGEKDIVTLETDKDEEVLCNMGSFFAFPYLNNIDIAKVPNWAKDTIWYQIFPDRFANGNPDINPENVEPWGSEPTSYNFTGGDLQGIIDHLDYLKELGISGIYLCPITEAGSNHRYDTIDYMKIDKYLGDEETLRKLIDEAHKRDIKIMLDAVFNHAGYYSKQWQDVIKNKEKSKYIDWFYISDINGLDIPLDELDKENLTYETFAFSAYMPKLNTENQEVLEYLINVGKYWVEKFDIDAWRLDVSNEVDHVFWRTFREEVKAIKPDVYILGEIWHNSLPWLMGDQFDSVMNYPLTDAINDFLCTDKIDAKEFKYRINDVLVSYPMQINEVTFNLLGSHDTSRILSLADGNKDKVKLAYLFMLTQVGSPCIYYGDEIGIDGEHKPGIELHRKCMVWDEEKQDRDMFNFMKQIIKMRKEIKELKMPINEWIEANNETQTVIIKKGDVSIIINNNNEKLTINLPKYLQDKKVTDLFNEKEIILDKNLTLNPYGYFIAKQ
ncbi:glycoside hydrolase family 13 protein [[Clostridium] dakarense]|uniref:glycoside hydrolase family 13 protein n=1 Tax=Faecalimicrobium dakarense TaxID=1301100 RepID=UPI0004B94002|nr:glycoside hydrolase family 13 protein [[Clostridium] dakarense]